MFVHWVHANIIISKAKFSKFSTSEFGNDTFYPYIVIYEQIRNKFAYSLLLIGMQEINQNQYLD